MRLYTIR